MCGDVPKEHKDRTSKKYIRVAFDRMAASVNLPPYGAVDQVKKKITSTTETVSIRCYMFYVCVKFCNARWMPW
jgi:hypothetical protein